MGVGAEGRGADRAGGCGGGRAGQEQGGPRRWARWRGVLARDPDWPLLRYGEAEWLARLRRAQRQGASEAEVLGLRSRRVDVHARLRRHWRLPVNGYGLKPVAGCLGFRWSQPGVDGARCLLCWRPWRHWHQDRVRGRHSPGRLQWIFQYNRDDSLATWAVARWLLDRD